jgi:PTH1 family peptidyl-tRNA hydrolase
MKLFVGLGNPGARYGATRHNAGARVVEALARRWQIALALRRFDGRFGEGSVAGVPAALLLPETFMNRSGASVREAVVGLGLLDPAHDLLIVLDDVDLPLGRLRLRAQGSDGGQRGLRDVLAALGTEAVPRLRFGVGRSAVPDRDTKEHVLASFDAGEEALLDATLARAVEACGCFADSGIDAAMNAFNAAA